ncbi:hypothetical protein [Flavobacterium sp.]|uniref:hypothetical protein n=1 Tax=Flavobacterium sp. TaxID=239 RepID=UPI00120DB87B|nr:hypothetical protein [Flavobacterium sp.]RZJ73068.1 MAG: hypothetical protein EOO49_05405 [Flavobacterium sp.]
MKNAFLSLAALLCFGVASAQTENRSPDKMKTEQKTKENATTTKAQNGTMGTDTSPASTGTTGDNGSRKEKKPMAGKKGTGKTKTQNANTTKNASGTMTPAADGSSKNSGSGTGATTGTENKGSNGAVNKPNAAGTTSGPGSSIGSGTK